MQTRDLPPELLLPPKRLGSLLAGARVTKGYSLEDAARELGRNWSTLDLLEVETGRRPVLDPDIAALTDLYGIPTTDLIPERSRLVIDLTEGTMAVGEEAVSFGADRVERRDVLGRYLAMVYSMRDMRPGRAVPLRTPDLEILEGALQVPRRDLEAELQHLMLDTDELIEPRMRRLRGRVLIPVIGVVVAATTAGMLLLVADSEATQPEGADTPVSVETEIGDAVVQERLPDGTPGPVVVRD